MRLSCLYLGVAILFLGARVADAQGHFVRHGFQITAPSYSLTDNRSKLTIGGGYHIRRIVELGLGFERFSDHRTEIVTISWVPAVAVYPLIQSAEFPFTLRLGAAYEQQSLSGDPLTILEDDGVQTEGRAYRLEAGISHRMHVKRSIFSRQISFMSILSFSRESTTVDTGNQTTKVQLISLFTDFLIEIDAGRMATVIVGPRVGVIDDEFGAGFSLGMVAGYK